MSLINCQESWFNRYNNYDGIKSLFIGPNERSNLEYLSLANADIRLQKNLDALIDNFIADHRTLKEVDLSIRPLGFQYDDKILIQGSAGRDVPRPRRPDLIKVKKLLSKAGNLHKKHSCNKKYSILDGSDEWASLKPKQGIRGL